MSDLLDAAHAAAKLARAHGADEAAIYVSRSRGVEVEWRDGRLERVQEETRRSLSAELYVNGRYSASSTNDLRPAALEAFLREAVEMTRLLEPDLYRGLPDPARYPKDVTLDLDLCDPGFEAVTGEARRAQAELLEQQVRALADDLSIISVTSGVGDSHGQSARVHTNGFEGEREGTTFSMSVMVTVKDADGRRPMGWDYTYRRHRDELLPTDKLARTAVDRARSQLGAGRLATGKYTLVVDPKAVPRLLGALFSPLSGPALQQRRSLFEDRLNTPIASKLLTIIDEPHRKRGLGASLWDGDGIATVRRPIIEAGVLRTFFIDQYYARKLGVEPTGAGRHNLEWQLGEADAAQLVAQVGDGVYIDRFLGGNSNQTTGELSYGCAGRVIRDGALAEPVAEVNLAGHFGQLWERLIAVGNDPDPESASACPTCVFEAVQLSGD